MDGIADLVEDEEAGIFNHPYEAIRVIGEGVWHCVACGDNFTLENEHLTFTHQEMEGSWLHYCRECVHGLFEPIANGDESSGLPKIEDAVLIDYPTIMEGLKPDLRQRFERGLVSRVG